MHLGRSNNLKIRLLDHGLPSGTAETATLAFRIAREQFPDSETMTYREFAKDPEFDTMFRRARNRFRYMKEKGRRHQG